MAIKLASDLVKRAYQNVTVPAEVENNLGNPDVVGPWVASAGSHAPDYIHALGNGSSLKNLEGRNSFLQHDANQRGKMYANYVTAPALATAGAGLGLYGLYQALRSDVAPQRTNQKKAIQAQQTTQALSGMPKAANFSVYDTVAPAIHGLGQAAGIAAGTAQGAWNAYGPLGNKNLSVPLLMGIPAVGYGSYRLAQSLKPKKTEALEGTLKDEVGQFNQLLQQRLQTKSAALHAVAGLLEKYEAEFEKCGGAWDLYMPLAGLGAGAAGIATYKMMNRLDPDRIAYEAAKDAYARQQMVQKPKLKLTSVDPNENPDDVAGLSTTNTLMVPLPSATQKQAGAEQLFREWYTGLEYTEKVASVLNMIKQADINAQQIQQILHDDAMLDQVKRIMGINYSNDTLRSHIDPNDPKIQQQINDALAKNPQLQQLAASKGIQIHDNSVDPGGEAPVTGHIEAPLDTTAGGMEGEQNAQAMQHSQSGVGGEGAGGNFMDTIKNFIMQDPMRAAGIAGSLLLMGGGHEAMGLIGILLSLFGKDIWHYISHAMGTTPDQAQAAAAQQGALPPGHQDQPQPQAEGEPGEQAIQGQQNAGQAQEAPADPMAIAKSQAALPTAHEGGAPGTVAGETTAQDMPHPAQPPAPGPNMQQIDQQLPQSPEMQGPPTPQMAPDNAAIMTDSNQLDARRLEESNSRIAHGGLSDVGIGSQLRTPSVRNMPKPHDPGTGAQIAQAASKLEAPPETHPPVPHNTGNASVATMGANATPKSAAPAPEMQPPAPPKPAMGGLAGLGTQGGSNIPAPSFNVKQPFANNPLASK